METNTNKSSNTDEIMKILKGYRILNLDDTFQFSCSECGKCCKHREDILLNARDVFNMSKELNISPQELIKEYCEVYIGHDSRIPIIRILPRGNVRRCPFLKSNKCIVHNAKPSICALFPIGRVTKFNPEDQSFQLSQHNQLNQSNLLYVIPDEYCNKNTNTYTVRQWLEMFNIPVEDEFYFLWSDTISKIGVYIRSLDGLIHRPETLSLIYNTIYALLYINYDSSVDFLSQFKANQAKLLEILEKSKQFIPNQADKE